MEKKYQTDNLYVASIGEKEIDNERGFLYCDGSNLEFSKIIVKKNFLLSDLVYGITTKERYLNYKSWLVPNKGIGYFKLLPLSVYLDREYLFYKEIIDLEIGLSKYNQNEVTWDELTNLFTYLNCYEDEFLNYIKGLENRISLIKNDLIKYELLDKLKSIITFYEESLKENQDLDEDEYLRIRCDIRCECLEKVMKIEKIILNSKDESKGRILGI